MDYYQLTEVDGVFVLLNEYDELWENAEQLTPIFAKKNSVMYVIGKIPVHYVHQYESLVEFLSNLEELKEELDQDLIPVLKKWDITVYWFRLEGEMLDIGMEEED